MVEHLVISVFVFSLYDFSAVRVRFLPIEVLDGVPLSDTVWSDLEADWRNIALTVLSVGISVPSFRQEKYRSCHALLHFYEKDQLSYS